MPNPFNPAVTLRFDLAQAGAVALRIYDVSGRLVRVLVRGSLPREVHTVSWDGTDEAGNRLPAGVYLCKLSTSGGTVARKLVLLR